MSMYAFFGGEGERPRGAKKAVMALALPAAVVAALLVVAMLAMASPAWAAPASFSGPTNFGAGVGPISVAAADLNGDGKPDLAVAIPGNDNVSVFLGKGDGTFEEARIFNAGFFPQIGSGGGPERRQRARPRRGGRRI